MAQPAPSSARVVIVGGGIAGTSVAHHLVEAGWHDVLLLEQNQIAGGTTFHAAGMVSCLRVSSAMMRVNQESARLYAGLAASTQHDVGWRAVGSLMLARGAARMTQYRRTVAMARHLGVECHEIGPRECGERFPGIRTDDLAGGFWLPHDGRCLPAEVPKALRRSAERGGARVAEGVRVTGLRVRDGRVHGVETDAGPVEAEHVVLCGGMWTRQLALAAGVNIPLHPVEHHYAVSHPIEGCHGGLPCARDMDGSIYFRGEDVEGGGAVMLGAFQRTTKIWDVERVPDDFSFRLLEPDWEKFAQPLAAGIHRIPALERAGFARFVNGPESFTPDNQWLMGETPEVDGLWVLAGFNSGGIASAGGAGKALAQWMVGDGMPFDLGSVDIRRFGGWANRREFLRERVTEALGLHYEMAWPNREYTTGRGQRKSGLHEALAVSGACFGVKGGWERPNWFASDAPGCAARPETEYAFGRQNWFANHGAEHRAARERVALFDQSGFAKLEVSGREAAALLQRCCANNVDVEVGRAVYTPMLNRHGGYEADLTVVRTGPRSFLVVTGSTQGVRDAHWLRRQRRAGEDARCEDTTDSRGVLGVMGPRSRELLARVALDAGTGAPAALDNAAFPFGTARSLRVGGVDVLAVRITYVGELGWELHGPMSGLAAVHAALWGAGADLGVANAGHYAINSLRIEKGYRAFGAELSSDESPLEAGLGFTMAWDKAGGFTGREALAARRGGPLAKRLGWFVLEDPGPVLWGSEPILRDGREVGYTTSGAYGHTLGAAVGLGYVKAPAGAATTDEYLRTGRYEVLVNGEPFAARLHLRTPLDPERKRILG